MDHFSKEEVQEALVAINTMISRTENAKGKFAEGTSQHTLQTNRLKALEIASSLLSNELAVNGNPDQYAKDDLEKALAPLASLLSKSEKAQAKLAPGSWQHTMLGKNIKALHIAFPLVQKALAG